MNPKNAEKVEFAKNVLAQREVIFRELKNGQLQIDTANFWATSEKWYDPKTETRGKGLNSFLKYLKDENII
ncbi:hypothetical protein [Niallia circulans]|uniref:hypothetical protein n=1 Tax=Niallia circulans TaxID=1397 RepID=UPI0026EE95CC|nr:hypothetical protein [Niallia circulans]